MQAGLAEVFGNQEAAGKRLARLLQNRRISPTELSQMVFEQVLNQLPKVGKIRLAFDWTLENKQYLLVICEAGRSETAGQFRYFGEDMKSIA